MKGDFARKKIFSIPNALSIVRICLIPVFIAFYFVEASRMSWIAALILLLSGATDVADGMIARHFHTVTELGQILDPLADKLTQATVCVCLVIQYASLWWLLMLFIVKEALMIAGGARLLSKGLSPGSSKWYGKLATVVFYIMTILIIAFRPASDAAMWMMVVALLFMLFSFSMYLRLFVSKVKRRR